MASSLNVIICGHWFLLVISPYAYANMINPVSRTKHQNHPKHLNHPNPIWKNAHATFYGGSDGTQGMGTFAHDI
ncbi:hypothetical protein Hanom_Chr06g00573121 [Helianthus anomalus]